MTHNKINILARLGLFLATVIWGSSFFLMKNTVNSVPIYYLLAIRFSFAAVLISAIFIKRIRLVLTMEYLARGAVLGLFLFCAYTFQTYGVIGTTPGKNAFLTAMYCVLVPFIYWIYAKIKPDKYNIAAALLCLGGIGLVSLTADFTIIAGDYLTIIGSVFYGLHIVAVAKFSKGRDIFVLTIWQFAAAAIISWVFALLFNDFPKSIPTDAYLSLGYLCIFATTAALLLQNVGQKYVPPSAASIILSLESVFGVLFSILFYGETLTLRVAFGFAMIFTAIIVSETKVGFTIKLKRKHYTN